MFILHPSPLRAQGSLTPPGAPAPLFKTLQQIEPRTPIVALPFASYSLQVSSNLMTWLLLSTSTATNTGLDHFIDADAPLYSNRFSRVVLP